MPGVLGYAREAWRKVVRFRDRWLKRAVPRDVPCRRGCEEIGGSCCQQPVGALVFEGVLIAGLALEPTDVLPPRGSGRERGVPCPFLGDGLACSIYAWRPISCSTLFPARSPCTPTTAIVDHREPVYYAREVDITFCRRAGISWKEQPWPGPLILPAAVRLGRHLLAGERAWALCLDPADRCMDDETIAKLTGRRPVEER